jgi:RimJ/RimL family protein N-acetyltransferase
MVDHAHTVGLIRLLDLGDIGAGAPRLDLRIATKHQGHGYGKQAAHWVVDHAFTTYAELHRLEAATTRRDNAAMQRVLSDAGFVHEGTLRDAWRSDDGQPVRRDDLGDLAHRLGARRARLNVLADGRQAR